MMHSDSLNELAGALAAARPEFAPFRKEHTAQVQSAKGGYIYRYGDLSALFEATTPALSKHGLMLSQWPCLENGAFVLVTLLLHSSGQWIRGTYPLTLYERPQEQGSAITYAKRYAAASVLGVAAELDDDDGALASSSRPPRSTRAATRSAPAEAAPASAPARSAAKPLTEKQRGFLFTQAKRYEWSHDQLRQLIEWKFGISSTKDLQAEDLDALLMLLPRTPSMLPAAADREPGQEG